jgi:hypothetical protein
MPASTEAPYDSYYYSEGAPTEAPAVAFGAPAEIPFSQGAPTQPPYATPQASTLGKTEYSSTGSSSATTRMVIKNANIQLRVENTDVGLDRTTQIVSDFGGYIVSSQVWYAEMYGVSYKYATVTFGIPSLQFENALRRLRGIAVKVLNETASGEDVTDQYVDLQSQLGNLEATRDRIRTFLAEAKTVDEALRVNQELSNIERQIEEIKGRINYLSDRSAFSTISVSLEPVIIEATPTVTFTPTATATKLPTATPTPWKPSETFGNAKETLTNTYQGLFEFLIWVFVFIFPLLLPFGLIIWAVWYFMNKRKPKA